METYLKMVPLLQKNYGGANDCTLTSITSVLYYYSKKSVWVQTIYDEVERVAKKHFFSDRWGTNALIIKAIMNDGLKFIQKSYKSKSGYVKGLGFNLDTIKKCIDKENPVVLTMANDGTGKYKSHSVTIIGYDDKDLIVYDNWTRNKSYIDYDKLSIRSSINWVDIY